MGYNLNMKSKTIAYLLWFIGGLGCLGLHRFYMDRFCTGTIWICTLGLFGIGALIDLFLLANIVQVYNSHKYRKHHLTI